MRVHFALSSSHIDCSSKMSSTDDSKSLSDDDFVQLSEEEDEERINPYQFEPEASSGDENEGAASDEDAADERLETLNW